MSDGKVIIKIDGDGSDFEKELQSVTSFAKKAVAAIGASKVIAETASAIYDLGTAYETTMAKVSTIADTASVSLGTLSSGVLELSNETGMAAAELSNALYEAISANVDTADAVEFTSQAVKLARGGFTDAASAVDVMTTVLNAYGLAATQSAHVSDVLIQVQNKGKTTVNELASNMGRVIPTAAAYCVSLENLGAAYAIMTSNGIATAETTTYLNSMLNELGKSGTTASDALKEATGNTFKQLMDDGATLGDVLAILSDHAESSGLSIADMFGSAEAGKAALTLLSKGADEFNASLDGMVNSTGLTESAFETMSGTAENSAEVIKNKFKNLGIEIYNQNSDSIDRILTAINDLADGFIEFAENAASKAADALTWIIDNADLLGAALQTAITAVVAFKATTLTLTAIQKASAAITAAKIALAEYTAATTASSNVSVTLASVMTPLQFALGVLTGKISLATAAQVALNKAKQASTGIIGLAVSVIAAAGVALWNYAKNADTAANKTKQVQEELNAINEEYEQAVQAAEDKATADRAEIVEADKLIERLDELDRSMKSGILSTDDYTAASKELKTVVNRLNEIFPDLEIAIDDETGALESQIEAVWDLYDAYKELTLLKLTATVYEDKLKAAAERIVKAEEVLANTDQSEPVKSVYREDLKVFGLNLGPFGMKIESTEWRETEAYKLAKQEVDAANAAYDSLFDTLYDEENGIYAQLLGAENALGNGDGGDSSNSEDKIVADYESLRKALDRQHKLSEISEAEYYKSLAELRDQYLDETSDEWLDVTVEINKYNKQAAEDAAKATDEQIDAMFNALKRRFDLGEISEAEYYAELEKLRDKYLDETDDRWLEHTLSINSYNESIAEEARQAYESARSEIEKSQQSFANKLLSAQKAVETVAKTYQFGNREAVTVEYTGLTDLGKQTKEMQAYADALEAVKKRGALPEGFFSELRDMSMEEGQEYATALLRLSDEDFAAYMDAWEERQKVAEEISQDMYTDEVSQLAQALEAEFGTIPEDFFAYGEESAVKYGEGFMSVIPEVVAGVSSAISAGLSTVISGTMAAGIMGASATNTTNNTYNLIPSGESTQEQLLAIQNNAALEAQRGV